MKNSTSSNNKEAPDSNQDQILPPIANGDRATVISVKTHAKKTRGPVLYKEGTLLGDMLDAGKFVQDPYLKQVLKQITGLGTPATRDSIIETLKDHKYIETTGSSLEATEKGTALIKWLRIVAPELIDVAVTAEWEAKLELVALKGGGSAFEKEIADKVKTLIAILKTKPPMTGGLSLQTLENRSMSESSGTNKPSDKMLEFAKTIATKLSKQVPDEVMTSYDACKKFIDDNKDTAMRPSDKQIEFAKRIAMKASLTIPEDTLKNGRDLSKWIDEHKDA